MMRVEEMYLIEAEATAHYDATTGKSLLQSFMANRDPAYTVPAANDLIDEIISRSGSSSGARASSSTT